MATVKEPWEDKITDPLPPNALRLQQSWEKVREVTKADAGSGALDRAVGLALDNMEAQTELGAVSRALLNFLAMETERITGAVTQAVRELQDAQEKVLRGAGGRLPWQ